ncbi:MerR family transcriptional regulator [Geminicoccus roseus]|uniref:MerR family transcriptional regulator n=1 Tax=Geminicoccus roseus TaxID=404900 RepID=UPI0004098C9C|nr:MerR family transcriptional regulator [Geminicoccus roseus]
MKISDVARLAGVSVSTLRVWEAQGMLAPAYTPAGTRIYAEADVETARGIQRMRTVQGMKIAEIKAALAGSGDKAAPGVPAAPDAGIGPKLRVLRQSRNLKIAEVARELGIKPSLLASLERTSLGLDIPLLKQIAGFYGITLNEIMGFEPDRPAHETVMRGSGVVLPRLGLGVRIERLGSGKEILDCQRWVIEPGVHSRGSYRHEGEEFLVVVRGQFEITLEEQRVHLLTAGDSIYFRSDFHHAWRNPGSEETELIWVCVGDTF